MSGPVNGSSCNRLTAMFAASGAVVCGIALRYMNAASEPRNQLTAVETRQWEEPEQLRAQAVRRFSVQNQTTVAMLMMLHSSWLPSPIGTIGL